MVQGKEKTRNGDQITSYTIIYMSKERSHFLMFLRDNREDSSHKGDNDGAKEISVQ